MGRFHQLIKIDSTTFFWWSNQCKGDWNSIDGIDVKLNETQLTRANNGKVNKNFCSSSAMKCHLDSIDFNWNIFGNVSTDGKS